MQKFSEKVLAPNVHMSKKASPFHPHSQGLVYTPKGKPEVLPIDTADAGYGGATVADAEGGDADPGIASKKAVSPMKMQTLVKAKANTKEGFDPSSADIAKMLVAKHGKNVTKDHIKALEQDRDSHSSLDHDEIMNHVKKLQEETERERLMKLRAFAAKGRKMGLGKAMVEEEQIDELKKSTLASYAKKATDDVSYHSFVAGTMSAKDPERLEQDKKAMKRQTGVIKAINKLVKEENNGTEADAGEYGYEGDMAMTQLKSIIRNAKELHDHLEPQTDLPEWVQSKITLAADYIQTAADYWMSEKEEAMSEGKADVRVTVHKDIEDFLKKGGKVKQLPPSKATHRPGTALASKMIGSRGQVPGLARNVGGKKPVVAVEEGKMKDIATNKAEDERLAAQDVLGGPVRKKPEGPKGKLPLGFRLARSAAKKAMKSVSEEQIDELMGPDLRSQQAKENDAHFKKQPPRMQTAIRYHLKNRKSYKDAVSAAEKDVATMHEEVWDKPMPDSKKQGSLSPEQKAKAKARAARAGRSYPNMIDNMWASKQ
jgi:hypothetical protein